MADHRLGFRSFDEETDSLSLEVMGELPDWLSGTLYRNGPGRFEVGDRTLTHWFDGFALLRRFAFRDGGVEYSSRFLDSDAYRATQDGELRYGEFGTVPSRSLFDRFRTLFGGAQTDNASITVRHRAGEHRAVTETAREVAFDPADLSTLGHRTGAVGATGTIAHDHYDGVQEEWVGLGTRLGRRSGYVLYRDPDDGAVEEIVRIERAEPAYVHSFALTDHYAVLTEHPLRTAPRRLLADRPYAESFRWYPGRETRFLVVDRRDGEVVAEPGVSPFFTFHHVDAFERGEELFVDLIAYEDHSIVPALSLSNLRSREPDVPAGELRRYRIDLETGRAEGRPIVEGGIEFPTIHYAEANLHPYRFCYGVGSETAFNDRLRKVDVEHGTDRVWESEGIHPGEALFVPRPDGEREDDGVLLSVALDVAEERSCVLVLDATEFEELARAYLPHVLPFDFHGTFDADGEEPVPSMS
ncbi:carotenoid oxygenase family protein [Halalkalicoccus jeotgali]|uniref:Lignostilbene-alpha,beta-dioxygenase n=1 Tax=Halalkalicoccus jeotgali (strain DSM 18796 / CECT 7217 / JCM 14584 / KCTC 4019 / B3) TaxID=795797 RepID=D8J2F1_HALJB|nr:carotenoid oxygenase family protein [Halalkalicoccus jeotgali]ADJ14908.1 lignostilbene-alpha,beta-dioxygenase [Halalkalicoccus jeotgali B3]ELY39490.1 lignostilbene-alpha,beta-dioxygenase [Halalkalicoccus jeotgali B3]